MTINNLDGLQIIPAPEIDKSKEKRRLYIFISALFLLVFISSLIIVNIFLAPKNKKANNNFAYTKPTTNISPTPTVVTDLYSSTETGLSFNYPKGYKVKSEGWQEKSTDRYWMVEIENAISLTSFKFYPNAYDSSVQIKNGLDKTIDGKNISLTSVGGFAASIFDLNEDGITSINANVLVGQSFWSISFTNKSNSAPNKEEFLNILKTVNFK